jgi:hypothetical protein
MRVHLAFLLSTKDQPMNWNVPRYEEIKMDAEIGSYNVDPDEQPDPTVSGSPDAACTASAESAASFSPRS